MYVFIPNAAKKIGGTALLTFIIGGRVVLDKKVGMAVPPRLSNLS